MYLKILTTLLISSFLLPAVQARVRTIAQDSMLVIRKHDNKSFYFKAGDEVKIKTKNGEKIKGQISGIKSGALLVEDQEIPLNQIAKIKKNQKKKMVIAGVLTISFPGLIFLALPIYGAGSGLWVILPVLGFLAFLTGLILFATTGYVKMSKLTWKVVPEGQRKVSP